MTEHEWSKVIELHICDDCGKEWGGGCECGDESSGITPVEFVPRDEAEGAIEAAGEV